MFIGYETLEKEIIIEKNQKYSIDIKLKPSSIKLQETRVTAEKRKGKITEAPASIEIISSRDIKRETTTNMGSYLKGLKGVDFTSSGINNYSISIRGFNSSFNTRVLTLTDGRVANLPALRVINYSAVPQSMDDIDRMEVVLGPATALYGANAHSGVVNIISKSPANSEGLDMSVSGSNDERHLRKINARWAKKLSNKISIKLSGMYLHAYEWPYVSEIEHKNHSYPWSGYYNRSNDGKDNNPWSSNGELITMAWAVHDYDGDGIHTDSTYVRIGNGEKNHDDLDGDGVAGEDWYNGYDDDGDCPGDTNNDGCICCTGDSHVDEDFFTANGKDDDGDGFIDEKIDTADDIWNDGYDNDGNGEIDDKHEKDNNWSNNLEEYNIIIKGGRSLETIHNQPNLWYDRNVVGKDGRYTDLKGDYKFDEGSMRYIFDIYLYDYGEDGIPGDHYIDIGGDGAFQKGECFNPLGFNSFNTTQCDCGLDGICPNDINYICPDADGTEGDGKWQPGDGWMDTNQNGTFESNQNDGWQEFNNENYIDVWPPPNLQWDQGEIIYKDVNNNNQYDLGIDIILENGIAKDGFQGDPFSDLNENNIRDGNEEYIDIHNDGQWTYPTGEFDGVLDTGDKIFGFKGDKFTDTNGNGIWDEGEEYIDLNNDNKYTPPDYIDNFQFISDINGDGLNDFPDFEVENRKIELRLDYDPSKDFNITFQSGYSWTKTQQVTGTSRYLADGFEYKYYQLRGRFFNWFSQFYINESFSGNTRNYNLGNVIEDYSKNYAFQLQHNKQLKLINTKITVGIDFLKTLPYTNGTILNDGPNGYDNDGDNDWYSDDSIDNDGDCPGDTNGDGCTCCKGDIGVDEKFCTDGMVTGYLDGYNDYSGIKSGKIWSCDEGIDERDEFDDPESNEIGFYYQSKTELFGTSRFELITAARWDKHDLLEEGIQFAPKVGFIYKPNEKSSMRFTYGKAFNTPNSITLYTDLFIRKQGIFDVFLRGNKDGTPYCRVGQACSGANLGQPTIPGYFYCDGNYSNGECIATETSSGDSLFNPISNLENDYFSGGCDLLPYTERVEGAPYFYNISDNKAPADMIPLDTARYLILIPELNSEGILYSPFESWNIPDVEPIKTEKIQTFEIGYKGLINKGTHFSLDYYLSYYEDFFSPPTFITPIVVMRSDTSFAGILPINDFSSHPPYGTAWNGIDDDNDWTYWAEEFGWGDTPDVGEWGFINYHDINDSTNYTIYHPEDIIDKGLIFKNYDPYGNLIDPSFFDAVGVDEYHPNVGLQESDITYTTGPNGEIWKVPGLAVSPPHLVLSPMNYGNVWMQGLDAGITQFIPEYNLIIDANISWYGTTEYYNKLTRKNDPINAPKWKWNGSIKWNSNLGNFALNYRHVNKFNWNDGIWSGTIGPYDIFDLHYNYSINDFLELNISTLNLMDNKHKELIGGAIMGRQIIFRLTSTF